MAARVKAARNRRAAPAAVLGRQKEFCLELINLARQATVPCTSGRASCRDERQGAAGEAGACGQPAGCAAEEELASGGGRRVADALGQAGRIRREEQRLDRRGAFDHGARRPLQRAVRRRQDRDAPRRPYVDLHLDGAAEPAHMLMDEIELERPRTRRARPEHVDRHEAGAARVDSVRERRAQPAVDDDRARRVEPAVRDTDLRPPD